MAVRIGSILTTASEALATIIANFAARRREVIRRVDQRRESDGDAARRAGFSPRLDPEREATYAQMVEDGIASARSETLSTIDQLESQVDSEIDRVRADVEAALHPVPSSTDEQVLQEMRQGRIADRLLRILDAEYARSRSTYEAVDAAIEHAVDSGVEAFIVLRGEIGAWLQAHDDALRAPNVRERIDAAMRPHLSGDQLQAVQALEELEQGIPRVAEGFAMTRQAIRGGRVGLDLAASLPGWNLGHDIEVSSAGRDE